MTLNSAEQTLKHLVRSCDATLDETRAQGVLDASAHSLLAEDLNQILHPLLENRNSHKSLMLPELGLPLQWRGIDAAADNLDNDEKQPFLNHIAKLIEQVLLYFNYEDLYRHPNKPLSCSA